MRPMKEILDEIKRKQTSDRRRQVLYISDSLIKDFRKAYPQVPVSRIIEAIFRDLLKEKEAA